MWRSKGQLWAADSPQLKFTAAFTLRVLTPYIGSCHRQRAQSRTYREHAAERHRSCELEDRGFALGFAELYYR